MAIESKQENLNEKEEAISSKTFFPSMECECEELDIIEIPEEYSRYTLADIGDGVEYSGKPVMGSPYSFTIDDDGEEAKRFKFKFFLMDEEEEEYLDININLKKEGDIQTDIRKGSVLFDLLGSIKELEVPGYMSNYNKISKVNLKEFREFINDLGYMKIMVEERTGRFNFYSFKVVEAKN